MSAVRRMKLEMTLKERSKRRAQPKLTPNDAAELERFKAVLQDMGERMPLPQLIQKHGAAYLGFTEEEVAAIEEAVRT
jgi:arsenate reductase-like glutaredoxin family protein